MEKKNIVDNIGFIQLYLGPMFSGKTTRLLEDVHKKAFMKKKTVFVKFQGDDRYTKDEELITHSGIKSKNKCMSCSKLSEIYEKLLEFDVIGIDEGQFFPDLVEICDKLCLAGKYIGVAALSGNFRMEPFENVSKLISKADKIKLMKAACYFCDKEAGFSLRIVAGNQDILIGSGESYKDLTSPV